MIKILKKILLFEFFLSSLIAHSQLQQKNVAFTPIDIKDGLSSYSIRKIAQDKYGFTWIATKNGLNRYDGKTFTIYTSNGAAKHRILANDVWDLCEDTTSNLLWVISSYGGLNAINTQNGSVEVSVPDSKDNFQNEWLKCLNICSGKIWVGTDDGLFVYDVQKKSFAQFEPIPFQKTTNIQNIGIDNIFVDGFDRVWVFIANFGLVIYSGQTNKILQKFSIDDLDMSGVSLNGKFKMFNSVVKLDSANALVATLRGFRIISYDKNQITTISNNDILLNQAFSSQDITSCDKDNKGDIWFATLSSLFTYNFKSNRLQKIQPIISGAKTNLAAVIYCIFCNSKNYLWLGTQDREVFFSAINQLKFVPVYQSHDSKIKIESAYFLHPLTDSSIYVCAVNGLYFINNNEFSIIDNSKTYWCIRDIDNKNFFVSNNSGCYVMNNEKKMVYADEVFPELKILRNDIINSGERIGDSIWVFASQNQHGIYFWNFKKRTIRNINTQTRPFHLESSIVKNLSRCADGTIWIMSDNNVTVYDPSKNIFKNVSWMDSTYKKPYGIFMDACEANGYYWIAAYGEGIFQVDKNLQLRKIISTGTGMLSTGLFTVTPVNDSLIFSATDNGLNILNVKNFKSKTYFQSDGLNSSAAWLGCKKNGIVYVGGDRGFTMIYPQNIISNIEAPQLYLDNIKIETKQTSIDSSNLYFSDYTVPSDFLQATVSFSGINYSNPSRTAYAYRIKEIDNYWIDLGTQNFITLIGLSPGKYTLEVKAANEDGLWCEPKTLTLTFLPKWYQTWWFQMLVGLSVALLLYGFYRYRLMQIRKQHNIRKEIAGDLHDDIGATINSVKIFTHLAETSDEKKKYFAHIKEALTQASTGLRDMIWVLDDAGDTAGDLFKRLKSFAHPVAEASGVKITFHIDDTDASLALNKTEKRNLLLIAKEAINNSIKYAECQNIIVTFSKQRNKTTLLIQDDGKGFADDAITPGNGLRNMRERAHQVHYNIFIDSENGVGTNITLVKK